MKGTGGCEATTTYIRLELWRVPRHELHEATRSPVKKVSWVFELWGKVLTCKVIVSSMSLRIVEGYGVTNGELDSHLEKPEIWHEGFAVHELDDRP